MTGQLSLVGPATPPELKLSKRQRFALEFIARRPVSSEELGAALHEYRRAHVAQKACRWCQAEGAEMGQRLRQDHLVRFARRLKVWYLVENGRPEAVASTSDPDSYDPACAEIPF